MNLDEAQRQKVAGWIEEGATISEIQKRLETELGIRMTYLDVRLLVDDLKLIPRDPVTSEESKPESDDTDASTAGESAAGTGGVSVTVDQVTRPGAMISGKVTFSDGNTAEWYLDQTGRLGIAPAVQGYRPSQEDVMAFQTELQNALAKLGF